MPLSELGAPRIRELSTQEQELSGTYQGNDISLISKNARLVPPFLHNAFGSSAATYR